MLRNSPDAVLMMLAVVKCGAVAGMLNYHQRGDVLSHSIGLLDAKVVVAESDLVDAITESGAQGGRAGMAAVKLREGVEFDGKALAETVYANLPSYAAPLFVRVVKSLETTSTFKSRKVDLRKQAYGSDVEDPLYVLKGREEGYVPFYAEFPEEVAAGKRPKG